MAGEEQAPVAALQEEIRQAGDDLLSLRVASGCLFWFPALFVAVGLTMYAALHVVGIGLARPGLYDVVTLALSVLMAAGSGTAIAAGGRAIRRARLREQLRALPESERAQVLLPLRREGGDTRRLVEPLIRELGIQPGEVAPASSPAGRGDEPGLPAGGGGPASG
jgi:hypothetical protein